MTYRDELEAAQAKVAALEEQLRATQAEVQTTKELLEAHAQRLAPEVRTSAKVPRIAAVAAALVVLGLAFVGALVAQVRSVPQHGAQRPPPPAPQPPHATPPMVSHEPSFEAAPSPPPPDPARGACAAVARCYAQANVNGRVSGTVRVVFNAKGEAMAATYTNGAAPASVRACLVQDGKAATLETYTGTGGTRTCTYQGEVFGGSSQLFQSSTFTPNPP